MYHRKNTIARPLIKVFAQLVQKLVAGVFEVVLVDGVVNDSLHITFVVTHFHF